MKLQSVLDGAADELVQANDGALLQVTRVDEVVVLRGEQCLLRSYPVGEHHPVPDDWRLVRIMVIRGHHRLHVRHLQHGLQLALPHQLSVADLLYRTLCQTNHRHL